MEHGVASGRATPPSARWDSPNRKVRLTGMAGSLMAGDKPWLSHANGVSTLSSLRAWGQAARAKDLPGAGDVFPARRGLTGVVPVELTHRVFSPRMGILQRGPGRRAPVL